MIAEKDPAKMFELLDLMERHAELQKKVKEEEQSSLLAPYLKNEAVELDSEMMN